MLLGAGELHRVQGVARPGVPGRVPDSRSAAPAVPLAASLVHPCHSQEVQSGGGYNSPPEGSFITFILKVDYISFLLKVDYTTLHLKVYYTSLLLKVDYTTLLLKVDILNVLVFG